MSTTPTPGPTPEKITASSPLARSRDLLADNVAKLRALFPELVTESEHGHAVNVDVLKQLVGDATVTDADEKYGLNWHGKRAARKLALTPSAGTLRPARDESVDWDTTQNLMIEGDNLEVLKLLQKRFEGKVKMIYIDPPYNTGNDFVYKDQFKDSLGHYKRAVSQDSSGKSNSSNTESDGRFHTNWLNMMMPRLKLAQGMLSPDGAIFVSCDESEHIRLRGVMDEIYGMENFIADFIWAAGKKNDAKLVSISHEYIVCYAKSTDTLSAKKVTWRQKKDGLDDIYAAYEKAKRKHPDDLEAQQKAVKAWFKNLSDSDPAKAHKHYANVDQRGLYFKADISWPGGGGPKYEVLHPRTGKSVKEPKGGWRYSDPATMQSLMEDDRVHFGIDETTVPTFKRYLYDTEDQVPYSVFYQDGRAATKRLRALMGEDIFDFPKDETVLGELVQMMSGDRDIVLDFFAGSGTTGHAVLEQNATDGGQRRYILVQLPEPLSAENKQQAAAASFAKANNLSPHIAALTAERLRRAAAKIRTDHPDYTGDLGFRVFKLDTSNHKVWDPDAEDLEQTLLANTDAVKPDRSDDDLLYELLLKLGLDLCAPIQTRDIGPHAVHAVGAGTLFVCLDKRITPEGSTALGEGIAAWREELAPLGESTAVFRDSAFGGSNVAKVNLTQTLRQRGIENVRSL